MINRIVQISLTAVLALNYACAEPQSDSASETIQVASAATVSTNMKVAAGGNAAFGVI